MHACVCAEEKAKKLIAYEKLGGHETCAGEKGRSCAGRGTACQSCLPQEASELVESRHGGRLNLHHRANQSAEESTEGIILSKPDKD
jgi:hypothetical protein